LIAKVIEKGEMETVQTSKGTLTKIDFIISDTTGCIKLTAWENHIHQLESGKSYDFQNTTVRVWNDVKSLSTSTDSTITMLPDIGEVNEANVHLFRKVTTTRKVMSACCNEISACCICNAEITINMELDTYKCSNCKMRQKTSSVKQEFKCDIYVDIDGKRQKQTIPSQILKSSKVMQGCTTADEIEDQLLKEKIRIVFENKTISDITSAEELELAMTTK
jgi:hypothetical protein